MALSPPPELNCSRPLRLHSGLVLALVGAARHVANVQQGHAIM